MCDNNPQNSGVKLKNNVESALRRTIKTNISKFIQLATGCEFISLLAAEKMIIVITIINSKTLSVRDDAKYLQKLSQNSLNHGYIF